MHLRFDYFNEAAIGTYVQMHDIVEDSMVPEHTHDFFEIVLVLRGRIIHAVNGEDQTVNAGDIFFIRPRDSHYYKAGYDAAVINIAFTDEVFHGFEQSLNRERFKPLLNALYPVVKNISSETTDVLKSEVMKTYVLERNSLKWETDLKGILYKLFTYLIAEEDKNDLPVWLNDLLKQMEKKENFVAGVRRLFELTDKSREHVARQMKQYVNRSPTEYINDLRLNYAKNQLILTNEPIVDICYQAGYENLNYFYKVFKRNHGITPNKYRNLNKAKII